ncbi:hypothetical protein Hanom_Chr00s000449g01644101 [Helianthus anomalus]
MGTKCGATSGMTRFFFYNRAHSRRRRKRGALGLSARRLKSEGFLGAAYSIKLQFLEVRYVLGFFMASVKTSTYVWETLFALSISILGLVLFSFLLGNMQKYLQSMTVRVEEMRVKRRDAELWMFHMMLPEDLKERVRRYEQYRWQ